MYNAIAQAFVNAAFFPSTAEQAMLIRRSAKQHGKFKEGWNANLSFKTYNALKAQGIMQ